MISFLDRTCFQIILVAFATDNGGTFSCEGSHAGLLYGCGFTTLMLAFTSSDFSVLLAQSS